MKSVAAIFLKWLFQLSRNVVLYPSDGEAHEGSSVSSVAPGPSVIVNAWGLLVGTDTEVRIHIAVAIEIAIAVMISPIRILDMCFLWLDSGIYCLFPARVLVKFA